MATKDSCSTHLQSFNNFLKFHKEHTSLLRASSVSNQEIVDFLDITFSLGFKRNYNSSTYCNSINRSTFLYQIRQSCFPGTIVRLPTELPLLNKRVQRWQRKWRVRGF